MKKKSAAQRGATGIRLTAFGYAMKARPGPETHTSQYSYSTTSNKPGPELLSHIDEFRLYLKLFYPFLFNNQCRLNLNQIYCKSLKIENTKFVISDKLHSVDVLKRQSHGEAGFLMNPHFLQQQQFLLFSYAAC